MPHRRLSVRLGALKPWRWLLDMQPLKLTVMLMVASPGMMWVIDILIVRGRLLAPNEQWLSALFDTLLALAIGVMVWALQLADGDHFPPYLKYRWFHWLLVGAACIVGAWHVWQEWATVLTLGPNWWYHNLVLYPLLGYLLGLLVSTVFVGMFQRRWLRERLMAAQVIASMLIGLWAWAGIVYDPAHQYAPGGRPKAELAHPRDPWCGGLVTRPLCELVRR